MSVEWPAALPLPQFGLRYNVTDPQVRTLMASGRTISRRRFSDVPTEFSARWILRQSEAEIFEQFYQNDAVDGSEWIEMPLVTPQGEGVHYVRFRGAYRYRRVGADLWEYSANLQMYLRPGSPEWPPGAGGDPGPAPASCGAVIEYDGGQTYPSEIEVELGAGFGNVSFRCEALTVPDRFEVWANGEKIIDTGYLGSGVYQSALSQALADLGEPDASIQAGSSSRVYNIEKNWSESTAIVKVFAPLDGTLWRFRLGCPFDRDPALGSVTISSMGSSISGTFNWRGGVSANDGKIYSVPYSGTDILIIDPVAGTAARSAMGADLSGSTKWWDGVLAGDGKIYCVPFQAADILIIDPVTGAATRSAMGADLSGSTKWAGGVLAGDGKIYCIPYSATDILIIDPVTGAATRSAMGADLSGSAKWTGGVLAGDGKVYCIPYSATDILIIDPVAGTATRSDMGADLSGSGKWSGGVLGEDGRIYGVPYTSSTILIIDPVFESAERSNMGASLSGSTKWVGGVLAGDGLIYCMPYNSNNILIIDVLGGSAIRTNMGADLSGTNKWAGGALGTNGSVYGIPASASNILIVS